MVDFSPFVLGEQLSAASPKKRDVWCPQHLAQDFTLDISVHSRAQGVNSFVLMTADKLFPLIYYPVGRACAWEIKSAGKR